MNRAGLALVVVLSGCLKVPDEQAPECSTTADCDTANGEVCGEGVCWGNPPPGPFAVVISPPSERTELAAKELSSITIQADGWIPESDLQLDVPVTFSGRIEEACEGAMSCDHAALAATLTITRPARFLGGPGFKTSVEAEAGVDGASFAVSLPPTAGSDPPYQVTIVPGGRGPAPTMVTTAQTVPPLRMTLQAAADVTSKTIGLGGSALPTIDGVVSEGGEGQPGYRVVALGRWEPGAPRTEVSTVAYTDPTVLSPAGTYHLVLAGGLVDTVEIVAKSYLDETAPVLHLANVSATVSSTGRNLSQPTQLGSSVSVKVPVTGADAGGHVDPIKGARVTITATMSTGAGAFATFSADATTGEDGAALLKVRDGSSINSLYRLAIVPPASSSLGVVFDQPMPFQLEQPALLLPPRVFLRGIVRDASGEPLAGVGVTARPSLRFTWSLPATPQTFLAAIPAATGVTDSTGGFVIPVDGVVADTWGYYDLVFEPPALTRDPTWVLSEVEIPREANLPTVTLADVVLPDSAFVHGEVTDAHGSVVEKAEVKVFQPLPVARLTLCDQVLNPPDSCPVPAVLQGRGAADANGVVRLTLPR